MRFLLPFIALLLFCSCNERTSNPEPQADYQLDGAIIIDRNLDSALIVIDLTKNDTTLSGADVTFDGDSLVFNALNISYDYLYSLTDTSLTTYLVSTSEMAVRDSVYFNDTMTVNIADTFSILTIEPPNHLLPGGGPVAVTWSNSSNSDGYILAAVLKDSLYTGYGYSAYSTSLNTADNIPTIAFTDGVNTVYGWYYIYVYAYTGSPSLDICNYFLPAPLPDQLPENISLPDLQGHFGSVIVTGKDSVYVYAAGAK